MSTAAVKTKRKGIRGRPKDGTRTAIYCRVPNDIHAALKEMSEKNELQPSIAELCELAITTFVRKRMGLK